MKLLLLCILTCGFVRARPSVGENVGEKILSRNLDNLFSLLSPEMGSFGICTTVHARVLLPSISVPLTLKSKGTGTCMHKTLCMDVSIPGACPNGKKPFIATEILYQVAWLVLARLPFLLRIADIVNSSQDGVDVQCCLRVPCTGVASKFFCMNSYKQSCSGNLAPFVFQIPFFISRSSYTSQWLLPWRRHGNTVLYRPNLQRNLPYFGRIGIGPYRYIHAKPRRQRFVRL